MSKQGQASVFQSTPRFPTFTAEGREHSYKFSMAKVAQNYVIQSWEKPWNEFEDKLFDDMTRTFMTIEVGATMSGEGDRALGNLRDQKSSAALMTCLAETPRLTSVIQPKKLNLCRSVKRNHDGNDYGDEDDKDGEIAPKKSKIDSNDTNGSLSSDSGRKSLEENEWKLSPATVSKVLTSLDCNSCT